MLSPAVILLNVGLLNNFYADTMTLLAVFLKSRCSFQIVFWYNMALILSFLPFACKSSLRWQKPIHVPISNLKMVVLDNDSFILTIRSDFLQFLKHLRSPLCLSVMLSCLVKLHNVLRDDSPNELSHEHTKLWPTTVTK